MKFRLVFWMALLSLLFSCSQKQIKVVCVGDSITEGYGISIQSKASYPVELNKLLGPSYAVENFGRSATTMSKDRDFPYWVVKEFSNVFAYKPQIIVIRLLLVVQLKISIFFT